MRHVFLLGLALLFLPVLVLAADTDDDGILDSRDACPGTPDDATVVDPANNLEYAGCTCDQVEEHVDTDNECISFYCHGRVLEIRDAPYGGPVTDCPEDRCDGYDYYDYPPDGFSTCEDGEVVPYSCEPDVIRNSSVCGYTGNQSANRTPTNETGGTPLPSLVGETQTFRVTDATVTYAHPPNITRDEEAVFQVLFVLEGDDRKELDADLLQVGEALPKEDAYCGEEEDVLFCTASWQLRTGRVGEQSANLTFTYDTGGETVQDSLPVTFTVRERPFAPTPADAPVVGADGLTPREEILVKDIHDELSAQDLTDIDKDSFLALVGETWRHARTSKTRTYDAVSNRTAFTITITPKPGTTLRNLTVIEYIPKELAESTDDLVFSEEPVVVRDDPLIMWHFSSVDERVDLSYEAPGEAEVTGNTVSVARDAQEDRSVWYVVLPLLLIPFIALLLIGLPRVLKHRKR